MPQTIRTPVFNRYEVLEKIGSGGMGTVYKARDTNLDRCVALKVLPPGLQEHAETLERFRREARVLACLKHPSIAAVYDASIERGFPYLVLEFVEGNNLERMLAERGRLEIHEAVRLGIEIAEALEHIHQHHVIHRDVKTSNIIVEPEGRAVLADFGIALVASLPRISRGALGTPEYMSPEQADGKPLNGRADVYSLGVVLYECLTGTVPFERAGDSLAELTALMKEVMEGSLPPVRQRRSDVPVWLATVVERCLEKDPQKRYASGAELAQALRKGRTPRLYALANGASSDPSPASQYGKATILEDPDRTDDDQGRGPLMLISHIKSVVAVAFSQDSRRFATASGDRIVRIWEVATGQLLHTLAGHDGHLLSIAFSPDGHLLASGDVAGIIHLWDARTGRVSRTFDGHSALVMSVAFSPDGTRLAAGYADGLVRLWDVRKGQLVRTTAGHAGYTLSVAYSADGRHLASGGADGTIRIWDADTGRLVHTLGEFTNRVIAVAFSPDRQFLASGGADGAVRIWEVGTGQLRRTCRGHRGWVMSVSFSPDGERLASAGRDHAVCLWEAPGGRLVQRLEDHGGEVMSVAYSPNGRYLATGSKDKTVRLRPLRTRASGSRLGLRRFLGLFLFLMFIGAGIWTGIKTTTDTSLFGRDGIYGDRAGWTMVVAAPSERSRAEQIAARLRRLGYRSGVFSTSIKGRVHYSVGVGQFAEESAAVAAKKRVAGEGKDLPETTWIAQIGAETMP